MLLLVAGLAACSPVMADQEPWAAPAGYQSACIDCHAAMVGGEGDRLYSRSDRLVSHYAELSRRVQYCSQGAKTAWSCMQNHRVLDYLNRRYYRFTSTESEPACR